MTLDPYVGTPLKVFADLSPAQQTVTLRLVRVFLKACSAFRKTINQQGFYGDGAEEYVIRLLDEGYLKFAMGPDRMNPRELVMAARLYNPKTRRYVQLHFDPA